MTQHPQRQAFPAAPDPILAELLEVKREINEAAYYRIDVLVDLANQAAERVRAQWRREGTQDCRTGEQTASQRRSSGAVYFIPAGK